MNILEYLPFVNQLPKEQQLFVANLLLFVLALIAIWVLRNVVTRLVMTPLRRIASRSENQLDDQAVAVIERPLRVMIIGIAIAIVSVIFDFSGDVDRFADALSQALTIVALILFVYNLIDVIGVTSENLERLTGLHVQQRLLPFMRVVTKMIIVVLGLTIVLQVFGYNATGLIASFGVVGLAFSLAAQDTAANIFGFTAIVSDNPFQVGDYIEMGTVSGVVETVGVRSTRIRKLDQSLVTVPNSTLTNSAVTNWSRLRKRRMDFIIGLTYSTNSGAMREVLGRIRDMLLEREIVDPESVVVRFIEFGSSSLDIRIIAYAWIADWAEFQAEVESVNLEIMDIVESMGLSMAFPSRSLYIESLPRPATDVDLPQLSHREETTRERPSTDSGTMGKSEATYQDNATVSSDGDGDSGDGGGEGDGR